MPVTAPVEQKIPGLFQTGDSGSFHKLLNRLAQSIDGAFVAELDGIDHAVADVVVQDHLAARIPLPTR